MLKKIAMAALASVTMSAFAHTTSITTQDKGWNNDNMQDRSVFDLRKRVEWRANDCLSGGDRFELSNLLDRSSLETENALLKGIVNAHHQAKVITEKVIAMRFPVDTTTTYTTSSNGDGTTTVTQSTTTDWNASNIDWSNEEHGSRPMRLVMANKTKEKDVSYNDAIDILCSNLSDSERGSLQSWWFNTATEREKDIVCRMLKSDASMADQTFYPSVYMHRTYSWINQ